MKEALFWKKEGQKVKCELCPRFCTLPEGASGFCRVRKNVGGKLQTLVYGRLAASHVDSIEKKPLFHFAPGSKCLSICTVGCNLDCSFCFTPDTLISTEKGIIPIKNLFENGSNEITKHNPGKIRIIDNSKTITHTGKIQTIKKAFEHQYSGDIITIKPKYTPEITCTPYHQFFISRNPEIGKVEKIKAKNLKRGDYLMIPKNFHKAKKEVLDVKRVLKKVKIENIKRGNKKLTKLKLKKMLEMSNNDKVSKEIGKELQFHPVYIRLVMSKARKSGEDTLFFKKTEIIENNDFIKLSKEHGKGIPRFINIDKNLAKLLGYFCAEGHITKLKNRPNSYNIVFSFGKHEKRQINETKRLMKRIFKVKARVLKRKTTTTVEVSKSSLSLLFISLCGHGAKYKKVPYILFNSKKDVIKAFLNAYIEGDGWYGKTVLNINTVSKELVLGVYQLFLNLNFLPSFYIWKPSPKKKIEDRIVRQSTLYYIKLQSKMYRKYLSSNKIQYQKPKIKRRIFFENNHYFFIPIHRINQKKYSGPVYNIEVDQDHSYLANFVAVGNCQNHDISHPDGIIGEEMSPEKVIELAKQYGVPGIAYTYTEPTCFFEYAIDTMKLAKAEGLYNVWVSNGYINPEPAKMAAAYLDAINVDLKGDIRFYRKLCSVPNENPMKESLKIFKEKGVWIEITNLLIPGFNDKPLQVGKLMTWVKDNLGLETPIHFSRFFPHFRMRDTPMTPEDTLIEAAVTAEKMGFKYVYIGNIGNKRESTFCPKCDARVIPRAGYDVHYRGDVCQKCGEKILISGKEWIK